MTDRSVIIGTVTMAQTALSRKQDHLIQQRSKILTTALELFSERGFAETPVREIAKRAGLAKGVVRPANKVLADYFEAHIQRGELRRVKTGPAARCLFGMLWGFLLNQELMRTPRGETLSDEEVVRVICDIFTHGIVAR